MMVYHIVRGLSYCKRFITVLVEVDSLRIFLRYFEILKGNIRKKWAGVSVKTANNSEDKISKNKNKMIIQECQ